MGNCDFKNDPVQSRLKEEGRTGNLLVDLCWLVQHGTETLDVLGMRMMAQYESISVDLMIQGERKAAVVEQAPVMDDGGSRNGPYDLLYRRMLRHLRLRCM